MRGGMKGGMRGGMKGGGFAVVLWMMSAVVRILAVVSLITIPSTAEASGKTLLMYSSYTHHISLYTTLFQSPITMNA